MDRVGQSQTVPSASAFSVASLAEGSEAISEVDEIHEVGQLLAIILLNSF